MKDVDFSVFHFHRRVLDIKEGPGLGVLLLLLLLLTLRCFFFNLYLIFFFLFFSVLDFLNGREVDGGVVLGVVFFRVSVSVWRLVSLFLFLFLIFLEVLVVFVIHSVNRYEFCSY